MQSYTVVSTSYISTDVLLLTIAPKHNQDRIRFFPGQYAAIGFKRGFRPSPVRCFSIVSSPNKPDTVQFAVRVKGNFTQTLATLQPGDPVFLYGPFGEFGIDEEYDRNVIFLAGGIGITPFMSMARYAAETRSALPITLIYSCGSQDNIPFFDELKKLEQANPHFKVLYLITQGGTEKLHGVRAIRGRLDDSLLARITSGGLHQYTYFVCGPKGYIATAKDILYGYGLTDDQIITEEFTPSGKKIGLSLVPRASISRWTYGLTAAAMIAAALFFMSLDLVQFWPKSSNAQAAASTARQASGSNPNNPDTSSIPTNADTSNSNSTSSTPTYSQTYKQPTSSVS
ncbi:MAG TPA: FAD-binding oxidoreductase [Candidatus Saccharimonadales bacterium]